MRKIICLATTVLLLAEIATAQDAPKEVKNDVGFNTAFVLDGILNANGGPFVFVYKRQLASNKALRYGVSFNINLNLHSGSQGNYTISDFVNVNPSFGKEWQNQLTKRWIWYYGGDIRAFIWQNSFSNYQNNQQNIRQENNSYGLSIAPFLGLRFAISERLYAATEASLNVGYRYQNNIERQFTGGVQTNSSQNNFNSFSANTASAIGIFIFYRF